MKCSKCEKEASTPVVFKGETLCIECGCSVLEKAKETETEIEAASAGITAFQVELSSLEAAVSDIKAALAKLQKVNRTAIGAEVYGPEEPHYEQSPLEEIVDDIEGVLGRIQDERDHRTNRIDQLEARLRSLRT